MSTHIKPSKAQISKRIESGGLLVLLSNKLAGPLKEVAVPLTKNILSPLGITVVASAIDAGIQKKIHGSRMTTLIISKKVMNDIIKIVQALEDSKGVTETIKNETKEGGFLQTLVGNLGWIFLGNLLSGKGIARAGSGNNKGKRIVRAGCGKE